MSLQGANVDCLALQGLRFSLRWWRYVFACERRLAAKPPNRETSLPILRAALQLASQSYLANYLFDVLLAVAVFVAKAPRSPVDWLLLFFVTFLARRLRAFEGLCLGLKSPLTTKQNIWLPTHPSRSSFSALLLYFLTRPNCCMGFPLNGKSVMMMNFI